MSFSIEQVLHTSDVGFSVCLAPQRHLLENHGSQSQQRKQTWRRPRTFDRGKLGALLGYVFIKEGHVHLTDRHIIKVNDGVILGDVTMHFLLFTCATASANNQNDPKLGGHEIFFFSYKLRINLSPNVLDYVGGKCVRVKYAAILHYFINLQVSLRDLR